MNQFILLVVMTFNTPNGVTMQQVQLGTYYDNDTCKLIGAKTVADLKIDFDKSIEKNTFKGTMSDSHVPSFFNAGYSCVPKQSTK